MDEEINNGNRKRCVMKKRIENKIKKTRQAEETTDAKREKR